MDRSKDLCKNSGCGHARYIHGGLNQKAVKWCRGPNCKCKGFKEN